MNFLPLKPEFIRSLTLFSMALTVEVPAIEKKLDKSIIVKRVCGRLEEIQES
jgi:hypothetical protein